MKDYYAPMSWYELDTLPEHECSRCDDKQDALDNAAEHLKSIISKLYSKEPLNLLHLENDLDELCWILNVKLEEGDLQIQRKSAEKPACFSSWIEFNNNHLKHAQ